MKIRASIIVCVLACLFPFSANARIELTMRTISELRDLAAQGQAENQFRYAVALMEFDSNNGNYNKDEYIAWFQKAAHQGHAKSKAEWARIIVRDDPGQSMKLFQEAADAGDLVGMYGLAQWYDPEQGWGYIKTFDIDKAIRQYEKVAARGCADASANIGLLYNEKGDRVSAHAWYSIAKMSTSMAWVYRYFEDLEREMLDLEVEDAKRLAYSLVKKYPELRSKANCTSYYFGAVFSD